MYIHVRIHTVTVEVKKHFQNCFHSTEWLNGNGETAFTCFEMVRSVLAPDQLFVHSIVSFLYTNICTCWLAQFTTSPFAITRLSFSLFAHTYARIP